MSAMFDNTIVTQVQQANDIVDVVSEHVNLISKGREMVGLCCFHEDHQPSMYVNRVKQIFKCFACGAGGDVFKFVQMRENLSFPQAIERLAQRAGIQVQASKASAFRSQNQTPDVDPNRLAKANKWAADHFHKNLLNDQKGRSAREYLAERKINSDSIKMWKIGLAVSNNHLLQRARSKKIPIDLLLNAGLLSNKNGEPQDKFVNRLMFPISDVTGRIIAFGGRTLSEVGPKYLNSPTTALFDKSNSLYGLEQGRHHLVSSGTAVVVEGYTDCIMAHQFDCKNVVATLGTSFTPGHGRMLKRYAKKVVLLFDNDIAGVEAANRALDTCVSQRIDINLASIPDGKDPCDFLLGAGKEAFEKLIADAVDVFSFKWKRLAATMEADKTLPGRKAAIEEFLQTVAAAIRGGRLSAVERGLIINRLSGIIGLSPKEINLELGKKLNRAANVSTYQTENQNVRSVDLGEGLFSKAQKEILEVLLNEPKLYELAGKQIKAEDFDVPMLRQVAEILFETLEGDLDVSLTQILGRIESPEMGGYIVELADAGEKKGCFRSRLVAAMEIVGKCRARVKINEIKETGDAAGFLRHTQENIGNENRRSIGMT